jgi:NhaA family Na+:H+ antiporter
MEQGDQSHRAETPGAVQQAQHHRVTEIVPLPPVPISRIAEPLAHFLQIESVSGVVLLLCTLTALGLANSSVSQDFLAFWQTPLGLTLGPLEIRHSLGHWINDGLMAIFFFVVGLEVKRELVLGELREWRLAALPLAAAVGGMVVPAALYLASQWGEAGERGWGIPMATDIAFVVGCLAVLGRRAPHSLRILLLSLAIADDIGAILVIAFGYTDHMQPSALGWGILGLVLISLLSRVGVRSIPVYFCAGAGVWFAFHESGVHATIAGVILGLQTPVHPRVSDGLFGDIMDRLRTVLHGDAWRGRQERQAVLRSVTRAAREMVSPLERLEAMLHPWVSFVIMPLFALANAGVPLQLGALRDPIAVAVLVGLSAGKPLGIVAFSWMAVRAGVAKLPADISWSILTAAGVLAGIGFTMSLFIATLALSDGALDAAKVGILMGSAVSAAGGMGLLFWLLPRPAREPAARTAVNNP